jgi:amidase
MAWFGMPVEGPMARSVADVALVLSALAGPDPRSPLSISEPGSIFARPLNASVKGRRVAWFKDMGGLPFEPAVLEVVNQQRKTFESLGFIVEQADPDFTGADFAFKTLRNWLSFATHGERWAKTPKVYKETLRGEIERGSHVTAADLAKAETLRTTLYQHMRTFFETYDYYVAPVSQVAPFAVTSEYPTSVNGTHMDTYIDWMKSCYFISCTGLPSISVPAGFTAAGLPTGLQIVGKQWGEWSVLEAAHAYEQATNFARKRPPL